MIVNRDDGPRHPSRRAALAGGMAGTVVGFLGFSAIHDEVHAGETSTDADVGFCQDMAAHHVQAIVMCERVLGGAPGGAVLAAATEVLRNQAVEVGMMRAWLADWGASTADPDIVMAWMGMNEGDGMPLAMMPGYATRDELSELVTLDGLAQGRRWLELMRAHHVGGVAMAEAATRLASAEKVVRLSRTQAEVQTYEIEQYDLLLAAEYR